MRKLYFMLVFLFILQNINFSELQSSRDIVTTYIFNPPNQNFFFSDFQFKINGNLKVKHCKLDTSDGNLYYFYEGSSQKINQSSGKVTYNGSYLATHTSSASSYLDINKFTIDIENRAGECKVYKKEIINKQVLNAYIAYNFSFNTITSHNENIEYTNLGNIISSKIWQSFNQDLAVSRNTNSGLTVVTLEKDINGHYLSSTGSIVVCRVILSYNNNPQSSFNVSLPLSRLTGLNPSVSNNKVYINVPATRFSAQDNPNSIAYSMSRALSLQNIEYAVEATLASVSNSSGTLNQVNGKYILLPNVEYVFKYKIKLSSISSDELNNNVAVNVSLIKSQGNVDVQISSNDNSSIILSKTGEKEVNFRVKVVTSQSYFDLTTLNLKVNSRAYIGQQYKLNEQQSRVTYPSSDKVNVICAVEQISIRHTDQGDSSLISTNIISPGQQYIEYYLNEIKNSTSSISVGRDRTSVNLAVPGYYNLNYRLKLKSDINNFCNSPDSNIRLTVKLLTNNVHTQSGGEIIIPNVEKTINIPGNQQEVDLNFENVYFRPIASANFSLQVVRMENNACPTPLIGRPTMVNISISSSLSQRVEYSMHEIKGPNEIINVPRGADTVTLHKEGPKNITYNISFLSDNNFCNADSESVTAVVELVNTSTTTSAGGYLKIPESERQKTITLRPREVKQITFNNIEFMPNVETILSLKLVSLTGNKCRTDFNGVSQSVKIIMTNPNLRQELQYYLKELKNSTETLQLGESVSEFNVPANGYYNVTYNVTLTPKPYYCTDSNVVLKLKLNLNIVEQQGPNAIATIPNSISNELKLNSSTNSVLVTFYNLYLHHNVTVKLRLERIDFNGICDSPLKGIPSDEVILKRYQSDGPVNPPQPPTSSIISSIQNCLVIWGYS